MAGDRVVVAAGPAGASCPSSPDRLPWPGWERLRPHSGVQGGCACGGGEPREAVLTISARTARRACSGLPGARLFLLEGESRQHGPALLSLGTRRAPHPRPAPPYLRQRIQVGFDGLPRSLSLLAMATVVPPDRTPALPPHAAPCRGNGERSRAEAGAQQGRRVAGAPGALEVCRALEPRVDRAAEGPLPRVARCPSVSFLFLSDFRARLTMASWPRARSSADAHCAPHGTRGGSPALSPLLSLRGVPARVAEAPEQPGGCEQEPRPRNPAPPGFPSVPSASPLVRGTRGCRRLSGSSQARVEFLKRF